MSPRESMKGFGRRLKSQYRFVLHDGKLDEKAIHKISSVLRMNDGENIELVDGRSARIVSLRTGEVEIFGEPRAEELSELDVYLAIIKGERMDWAVEKLSEIGVRAIHPIVTDRTIAKGNKTDRWARIAESATLQSGGTRVPEIRPAVSLPDPPKQSWFFDQSGIAAPKEKPAAIFIGPEGGWSDKERQHLASATPVSLGRRILRAETAAVIGAYLAS